METRLIFRDFLHLNVMKCFRIGGGPRGLPSEKNVERNA